MLKVLSFLMVAGMLSQSVVAQDELDIEAEVSKKDGSGLVIVDEQAKKRIVIEMESADKSMTQEKMDKMSAEQREAFMKSLVADAKENGKIVSEADIADELDLEGNEATPACYYRWGWGLGYNYGCYGGYYRSFYYRPFHYGYGWRYRWGGFYGRRWRVGCWW